MGLPSRNYPPGSGMEFGLSNPELDLWEIPAIDLAPGVSSYTLPQMAENSKVSWRVEVMDEERGTGDQSGPELLGRSE